MPSEEEKLKKSLYSGDSEFVRMEAEFYDFDDDTFIQVDKGQIIFKIEEFNSEFRNDNFDIQVYEFTSSLDLAGNEEEVWVPLYFPKIKLTWRIRSSLCRSDRGRINGRISRT